MTTTPMIPMTVHLEIGEAVGRLDNATRATLERLAHAIQATAQRCDAIGECGRRCTLRAGHPGEIHEEYRHGATHRFRLTGPVI